MPDPIHATAPGKNTRSEHPRANGSAVNRRASDLQASSAPLTPILLVQPWRTDALPICAQTLALWGFRSTSTSDVEDALRMAAEHQCRALVVDLDIPKADTLALVISLRRQERTRDVAIVALTRNVDGVTKSLAEECGCDVVLIGAVHPEALAAAVRAALTYGRRRAVA